MSNRCRISKRIINASTPNPFPNMKVESRGFEIPFWAVDTVRASRRPAFAAPGAPPNLAGSELLAPRGSILTLLLRAFASDLFVHGLGGGTYDPFVDGFARAYLGVELPRFVVASRTRYLFPEEVSRYEQASELQQEYKNLVSHTERYIDSGLFEKAEGESLRELIAPRSEFLRALQDSKTPEERSAAAHRLNSLNKQIKAFIDTSSVAQKLSAAKEAPAVIETWTCRTYPFFLFESGR